MFNRKNALKILFLFILFFTFSGQTSLEAQMKELNRLQAINSEALQSGKVKQENSDIVDKTNEIVEHKASENDALNVHRFQLIDVDYRQYNPVINGFTELKSIMKIDKISGETWLFVIEGQNGFWKRINN